ncbi:hypothetical protein EBX93_05310 [bacterium]|nr:hypothetical protein [bacterium]
MREIKSPWTALHGSLDLNEMKDKEPLRQAQGPDMPFDRLRDRTCPSTGSGIGHALGQAQGQ